MATSDTVCKFNQSGFCKFQSHCRKQHFMEICTNTQCSTVTCIYRHPRVCRYFDNFGRCKFADSCAYLHKRNGNLCEIRKNQEKEIEELRKEVEELSKQVHDLRNILHELSNSPNQANTRTSTSAAVSPWCSPTTAETPRPTLGQKFLSYMAAKIPIRFPQINPFNVKPAKRSSQQNYYYADTYIPQFTNLPFSSGQPRS